MRTRILRLFCESKCRTMLVVQKWDTTLKIHDWDVVRDFEVDEYDKAAEFAMNLSLTKKPITEIAIFDDGAQVQS